MPERKRTVTDRILTPARVNNRDAPEVGLIETPISGEQAVSLAQGMSADQKVRCHACPGAASLPIGLPGDVCFEAASSWSGLNSISSSRSVLRQAETDGKHPTISAHTTSQASSGPSAAQEHSASPEAVPNSGS